MKTLASVIKSISDAERDIEKAIEGIPVARWLKALRALDKKPAKSVSGKGARAKGANAEREFFDIINTLLGKVLFRRNVLQSAIGGQDSMSARNPHERLSCAVEVKRCETLALPSWIKQAKEQAQPDQVPVLAYRRSNEPWTVAVLMTPEQFAAFVPMAREWQQRLTVASPSGHVGHQYQGIPCPVCDAEDK